MSNRTDDNSVCSDDTSPLGFFLNPGAVTSWKSTKEGLSGLPKVGDFYSIYCNGKQKFVGFGRVRFLSPYVMLDCITSWDNPKHFTCIHYGEFVELNERSCDIYLNITRVEKMSQADVDLMVKGRKDCDLKTSGCICLFKGRTEHSSAPFPTETVDPDVVAEMVQKRFPNAVRKSGQTSIVWNVKKFIAPHDTEKTVFASFKPEDIILNFFVTKPQADGSVWLFYTFTKKFEESAKGFTVEDAVAAIQEMYPGAHHCVNKDMYLFKFRGTIEPCLSAVMGLFKSGDLNDCRDVFLEEFKVARDKDTGKYSVGWELKVVRHSDLIHRLLKEHPEARACRSVDYLEWCAVTLNSHDEVSEFFRGKKVKFFEHKSRYLSGYTDAEHHTVHFVLNKE